MKFKSAKEEQAAIQILKAGVGTEFWKLIVKALTESKEFIQSEMDGEDMKELTPELYKFRNENFKAKKQYLDTLMKTPENIVSWLEKPANEKPKEFDPYEKSQG